MAAISTHLHSKPYQVAVSQDAKLEFRKWNHLGTTHCVSHREAAMRHGVGEFIQELPSLRGIIFQFSGGFVHVGFG